MDKLISECHRIASIKQDTQLIEASSSSPISINAVKQKSKSDAYKTDGHNRSQSTLAPKTPCCGCRGMHFSQYCKQCHRERHKEGYCFCSKQKSDQLCKPQANSNPAEKKKNDKYLSNQYKCDQSVHMTRCSVNHVSAANRKYVTVEINNISVVLQVDNCNLEKVLLTMPKETQWK